MSEEQFIEGSAVTVITEPSSAPSADEVLSPTDVTIPTLELPAPKLQALEDASMIGKQFFIVAANTTLGAFQTVENDGRTGEPPSKMFKIEGEDGQAFVLTVADDQTLQAVTKDESGPQIQKQYAPEILTMSRGPEKRSLLDSDFSQTWFTTRDDKTMLQSKGASWKQGQWTKDEVELLQHNISEYCKDNKIGDPTEIIFEMCKDERKDFYRTIARGLQRPLFSVYRRVTRMYDQKNHMGKYSVDEMAKLREYRAKHGNDWAAIGAALGRSASSVKDKCRLMKDMCNSGKWLPEEEKRLAAAVYEQAGAQPGENVTQGLSWSVVAERVITRSEKQCRTKWLNYLNWKQRSGSEWTREDDMNLIIRVSNMAVSDDTEIDWNELAKDWDSVRSPQWLRGKWWSLKRHIPDYQLLPYSELLEYMKTYHLETVRVKNQPVASVSTVQNSKDETHMAYIPVALTGLPMEGDLHVDENDPTTVQAFEVLHQLPSSSGSYILTRPQVNGTIAMTMGGSTVSSDHIIVQTQVVPVAQENEDLTVLSPQVVITAPSTSDGVVSLDSTDLQSAIPLSGTISHTEPSLPSLTVEESVVPETSTEQLHTDETTFSAHAIVEDVVGGEGNITLHPSQISQSATDSQVLVAVTFAQSGCTDVELMSSLSDPMLNTDGNSLIGSADGDKSQADDSDLQVTVDCKADVGLD